MEPVMLRMHERPRLKDPVFVEGLPGVGSVGKIAIDHLIAELEPRKFAEIYSKYFPPQVMVDDTGHIHTFRNELYFLKRKGKNDIILLTGDSQAITPDGQYELSKFIVDLAVEFGTTRIYTLGGYQINRVPEKADVIGASTSDELIGEAKRYGVIFKSDESGGSIVGASGLIIAFGELAAIPSICLLGETNGFFVDPKGARAVLQVLTRFLDVDVDLTMLDERAKQIERITARFQEFQESLVKTASSKRDDLGYFG